MPPRYAYWTIIVDNQPTAFRASAQEDLMPTFKRLKEKHPSAAMMWFQNGKLWPSRIDAQEAMRARGERGRMGDKRQGGGFRDRKRDDRKPEWKPRGTFDREARPRSFEAPKSSERPEWKPKTQDPRPKTQDSRPRTRDSRPRTQDRAFRSEKLEWKPKGEFTPAPKRSERPEWKPRTQDSRVRTTEKRAWVPKAEYKKSQGIEAPRDSKWRPGGEHRDPKQKYKDAKKAKWTKFKKTIRTRWEAKNKKKS